MPDKFQLLLRLRTTHMPTFVCVSIRSSTKILKSWYGRSVVDGKRTLNDLFAKFASGEFDQGDDIGDGYQTTKVSWRRVCM